MTFFPLVAGNHNTALVAGQTRATYCDVNERADLFAAGLLAGKKDLQEERIAFVIPASLDYVTVLHGIWRAGGIALPLHAFAATAELEHYLLSAGVTRLIAAPAQRESVRALCDRLGVEMLTVDEVLASVTAVGTANATDTLPVISAQRRGMMLFTSGTTDKPKGVVITHGAISAQIMALVTAWEWRENDVIPLFLPLHHIHGIINILSCALWVGATVDLMPKLDVAELCRRVSAGTYSLFMAVPTIYVKLIDYLESLDSIGKMAVCAGFADMRLNVSGSAACPASVFTKWRTLTGQVLLERYGMTEIGMAIANPYNGERRAGYVGQALPGVSVQLFNDNNERIDAESTPGEIRIKSATVFLEYWDNPKATRNSFVDGWFCTGDIAVVENGYYRIMGRASVDIIKSGGYKLSALEIEGVLLEHDAISAVAVIGVPDATWGEVVVAFVTLRAGAHYKDSELKHWCRGRMSAYKIPKRLIIVEDLPRNALGKVIKPALAKLL